MRLDFDQTSTESLEPSDQRTGAEKTLEAAWQIQAYVKAVGDPEKLLSIVGADSLIDSLNTVSVTRSAS